MVTKTELRWEPWYLGPTCRPEGDVLRPAGNS